MSEKEQSIGAYWKNEQYDSQSGSFDIEGLERAIEQAKARGENQIKVIAFKNKYKEEERHPDYKVFIKRAKGEAKTPSETTDIEPF